MANNNDNKSDDDHGVSHCNIVSENDKDSRKQNNTYDGDEQYVK